MQGFRPVLVLSSLLLVAPFHSPAEARQSDSRCTQAIARISIEAGEFGSKVDLGKGIQWRGITQSGNPTTRTRQLRVLFSPSGEGAFRGDDLMSSNKLQPWANNLARLCSDAAVVSLGIAQSDYVVDFALDRNGTPRARRCTQSQQPKWDEMYCSE